MYSAPDLTFWLAMENVSSSLSWSWVQQTELFLFLHSENLNVNKIWWELYSSLAQAVLAGYLSKLLMQCFLSKVHGWLLRIRFQVQAGSQNAWILLDIQGVGGQETVSLIPLFFLFLSASLTIKLSNLQFENKQSNAIRSISIVKQSPNNWRYLTQGF